jgi:hypothetical protein
VWMEWNRTCIWPRHTRTVRREAASVTADAKIPIMLIEKSPTLRW